MDGYIGEIRGFAGTYAPMNWAFCQGQTMSVQEYTVLYSILGFTYGGDKQTMFNLPDLRGRIPIGAGASPELGTVPLGGVTRAITNTLTAGNLPFHTHVATLSSATITGTASGTITTKCAADEGDKTTPVGNAMAAINNGYMGTGDATSSMAPIPASLPFTGTVSGGSVTIGSTGASKPSPFSIVQPSIGINWIICLTGLYPIRN